MHAFTHGPAQVMSSDQHNESSVTAFLHKAEHNSYCGCQGLLFSCLGDSNFPIELRALFSQIFLTVMEITIGMQPVTTIYIEP